MQDRQRVIEELRDWVTITGRPLPYPAETIADLEALGFCVDLADGSVAPAEPIMAQRVSLAPAGRRRYEALKVREAA